MNLIEREEYEKYIGYYTLFVPTLSHELVIDLLPSEEIALKGMREVYPVEDVYKITDRAYAEELPYLNSILVLNIKTRSMKTSLPYANVLIL